MVISVQVRISAKLFYESFHCRMSLQKLPPPPTGFTVRIAKPDDQRDIISIRDVYDGLDYVDFAYPFYMETPNVYCYVMYLHDKPVCTPF